MQILSKQKMDDTYINSSYNVYVQYLLIIFRAVQGVYCSTYLFRNGQQARYILLFFEQQGSRRTMVSAPQMATSWCICLRFLLTVYVCIFKGVFVSLLYERLLIVVFMFVVNHAFCLSAAGSTRSHLLAARKGISLVIGSTCFIVVILSRIQPFVVFLTRQHMHCT